MYPLDNPVRHYAWGSATALPEFLGLPKDGTPWAEYWIGAHPSAPSMAEGHAGGIGATSPLGVLIEADPVAMLGADVAAEFGPRLPFLLKLIAPAQPLSIQVHPDATRARHGHRDGVYLDPFHKPEMVLALTPFDLLCGFRPLWQIATTVEAIDVPSLTRIAGPVLDAADSPGPAEPRRAAAALRESVAMLLRLPSTAAGDLARAVAQRAEALAGSERAAGEGPELWTGAEPVDAEAVAEAARTVIEASAAFPGDVGVVLSLLLRRTRLAPGQAVFVPAGTVHAYLGGGLGVEIMASSDNVVRGGLTPKEVNADELLTITDFAPGGSQPVIPALAGPVSTYAPRATEFALDVVELLDEQGPDVVVHADAGPRLVLGLDGELALRTADRTLSCRPGDGVFCADADGPLYLSGTGRAVVARVPRTAPSPTA